MVTDVEPMPKGGLVELWALRQILQIFRPWKRRGRGGNSFIEALYSRAADKRVHLRDSHFVEVCQAFSLRYSLFDEFSVHAFHVHQYDKLINVGMITDISDGIRVFARHCLAAMLSVPVSAGITSMRRSGCPSDKAWTIPGDRYV